MLKRGLAALGAAAALAFASQAGATVMTAALNGSFDPIRLGPNHQFIGGGWDAALTYDTDFGVASTVGGEQKLNWTLASGGPSPVTGGLLTAFGFDGTSYSYNLNSLTSFSLTRSVLGTIFSFTTADISFVATTYRPGQPHDLGADLDLDAAYSYSTFQSGLNPMSSTISTNDFTGSAYTDIIKINATPALAPIPEPATWGLLILGFGGVGAVLRRRRQVLVFRSAAAA
jgi:hypothetical protein